jgi:hypothetical protein
MQTINSVFTTIRTERFWYQAQKDTTVVPRFNDPWPRLRET